MTLIIRSQSMLLQKFFVIEFRVVRGVTLAHLNRELCVAIRRAQPSVQKNIGALAEVSGNATALRLPATRARVINRPMPGRVWPGRKSLH